MICFPPSHILRYLRADFLCKLWRMFTHFSSVVFPLIFPLNVLLSHNSTLSPILSTFSSCEYFYNPQSRSVSIQKNSENILTHIFFVFFVMTITMHTKCFKSTRTVKFQTAINVSLSFRWWTRIWPWRWPWIQIKDKNIF